MGASGSSSSSELSFNLIPAPPAGFVPGARNLRGYAVDNAELETLSPEQIDSMRYDIMDKLPPSQSAVATALALISILPNTGPLQPLASMLTPGVSIFYKEGSPGPLNDGIIHIYRQGNDQFTIEDEGGETFGTHSFAKIRQFLQRSEIYIESVTTANALSWNY